ncbi:SHOCT domain-containing protein [Rodentibacter caecimuris]|uniref:SHOCT domain-containing protein n=1 Tax=Rodentibacter caecimuris TaxID=1796644 RepID=UPI0013DB34D1|nr:SHOCT domain-containing protein [Rodentibacter heylii]
MSEELEKLVKLKDAGHLTEEEFKIQKKKILEGEYSAKNQPTFIIQNSASAAASAASSTRVVKKRGCLSTIAKFILGIFIFFLILSYFVGNSKQNEKNASKDVSSSFNSTQLSQNCEQSNKETYYTAAMHKECFINSGMPEFEKAFILASNKTIAYRQGLKCGVTDLDTQDRYQEQVYQAVSEKINKAGSLRKFCENELPYFYSLLKKYDA